MMFFETEIQYKFKWLLFDINNTSSPLSPIRKEAVGLVSHLFKNIQMYLFSYWFIWEAESKSERECSNYKVISQMPAIVWAGLD